jgi:hypothetical protein
VPDPGRAAFFLEDPVTVLLPDTIVRLVAAYVKWNRSAAKAEPVDRRVANRRRL